MKSLYQFRIEGRRHPMQCRVPMTEEGANRIAARIEKLTGKPVTCEVVG